MPTDTRQRIIDAALDTFSRHGYAGTSMRELAQAVGLGKSGLYKHFSGKQAIFNALVDEMLERHRAVGAGLGLATGPKEDVARAYAAMTPEQMATLGESLFTYWTADPSAVAFRRMLATERFHDERVARVYDELFVGGPLRHHEALFAQMMAIGALRPDDTTQAALAFWAPIHLLMQAADGGMAEAEARAAARAHVIAFAKIWGAERSEA